MPCPIVHKDEQAHWRNKLTKYCLQERYNMLIFTIAPLVHNFLMKHTVGLSSRLVLLAGNPQGNIW